MFVQRYRPFLENRLTVTFAERVTAIADTLHERQCWGIINKLLVLPQTEMNTFSTNDLRRFRAWEFVMQDTFRLTRSEAHAFNNIVQIHIPAFFDDPAVDFLVLHTLQELLRQRDPRFGSKAS